MTLLFDHNMSARHQRGWRRLYLFENVVGAQSDD